MGGGEVSDVLMGKTFAFFPASFKSAVPRGASFK